MLSQITDIWRHYLHENDIHAFKKKVWCVYGCEMHTSFTQVVPLGELQPKILWYCMFGVFRVIRALPFDSHFAKMSTKVASKLA